MKNFLLYALWSIAGITFTGSIIYAAYVTIWIDGHPKPEIMPEFLSWAASVIGGVLATNFGAVLGLSLSPDTEKFSDVAMFKPLQKNPTIEPRSTISRVEKVQIAAAYVYFTGMVLAAVFFAFNNFEDNPSETVILLPELSKTLIGAAVGALAVAFGNEN